MKTFDEIYNEKEKEDNEELKALWKELKKQEAKSKKIALIICGIVDFILLMLFGENIINLVVSIGLPVLLFVIVFVLIMNIIIFGVSSMTMISGKKQIQYNTKYKKMIIKKIISNFYDKLQYYPNKPMPEFIYEKLEYEEYNRYESNDYFEAKIKNKYSIQMANVLTEQEETHRNEDGEIEKETTIRFDGLFAKIIMEKSINSELSIMPNGELMDLEGKLNMDSSEFEKNFDVEASNSIIGMQLLTADVIEELLAFVNKTNIMYDVIIKDNILYLRFHCGEMFEPRNIKKGPLDRETLREYFYMLNFTYNLSNKLIKIVEETEI